MILILQELKNFSDNILFLNPPVEEVKIIEFEKKYSITLPEDYKNIIKIHNGFSLLGNEVYGIFGSDVFSSLEGVYIYEHTHNLYPMPDYAFPFSPDGAGNYYCFDSRIHRKESSPILFWQSGYKYTPQDQPEKTNETFTDWIQEVVVDWTLENYNYDGSEK